MKLFLTVLVVSWALAVAAAEPAEAPVCSTSGGANCNKSSTKEKQCGLYYAPSTKGKVSLFTGVDRAAHENVAESDIVIPMFDPNKNEYSPWHEFAWDSDLIPRLLLESKFLQNVLLPGVGSMALCSRNKWSANASAEKMVVSDSAGVHRALDPAAGSFSYHHDFRFVSTHDMQAGEEIFIDCNGGDGNPAELPTDVKESVKKSKQSVEWLEENGTCLDTLSVAKSTLPGVGRGAFAKRYVGAGEVITRSPVVHFDRSQVEIVEQEYKEKHLLPHRDHGIEYTSKVVGQQLLLNYCYGHPDSNILLFPVAPGVNFINHGHEKANAVVRWSSLMDEDAQELMNLPIMEFLEASSMDGPLIFDFVALRDISPGEEIFIDYGSAWSQAWENHVKQLKPKDKKYVAAADYNRIHANVPIRTVDEQTSTAYPENLRTACSFQLGDQQEIKGEGQELPWSGDGHLCLRPCNVTAHFEENGESFYTALVHSMESVSEPDFCGKIPHGGVIVNDIPAEAVTLVDKLYTSDQHLPDAFRHEIRISDGMYPDHWMKTDPNPSGDFIASPLPAGHLAPFRWADTAEVVSPWGFRVGLGSKVREVLLDYCDKMGIIDVLRHVTVEGNELEEGTDTHLKLDGEDWFLQRPNSEWRSNLHWLSPEDFTAHNNYLQALSAAGFDEVLNGIGEYLGMDGLVSFHLTFMATSRSTKGFIHYDFDNTGNKTFSVIVPLIKAEETGPELDILGDNGETGRYPYELDVGALYGDQFYHGTSAVDYRMNKEMRLAASIYVADVSESNVEGIMSDYTQAFPPRDDDELLLSWAGRHWKKDDPSRKLPEPDSTHILRRKTVAIASA